MQDSLLKTLSIPDATLARNPAPIAHATQTPVRVLISNTGAALLFLGFSQADVMPGAGGGATSSAFRIFPGSRDVFVLAPKQVLFASAAGPGGQASMLVSEAFPII